MGLNPDSRCCTFCERPEEEVIYFYELGIKFICDRCIHVLARLFKDEGFKFCGE
jgi:recombinational DNA repair protein (RecF pathway)